MHNLLRIALAAALTIVVAGCVVHNPFGGPDLVLTGNLQADMPGIKAYAADIRAGVKKDAGEVRAMFLQYCPSVSEADARAQAADPAKVAALTGISQSNAEKQVGNVQKATSLAVVVCAGGVATDVRTAFVNFATAAETILGWLKKG